MKYQLIRYILYGIVCMLSHACKEEGKATHCSILGLKIPWTEKPDGLQSIGHKKLDMTNVP